MALSLVEPCKEKNVGLINAAPFSARLLSNSPLPAWHKATPAVRETAAKAAAYCEQQGSDIAKITLQYSVANESFASCVTGSANPERVAQWCDWLEEPLDEQLVADVKEILQPIHNWVYVEGRPENNDLQPGLFTTRRVSEECAANSSLTGLLILVSRKPRVLP